MAQQTNPRALGLPGVEVVEADSQTPQPARPRPVRSRRRRRRQAAPAPRGEDEPRTFQVYKYSSRAPPTSAHCNGGSSPALPDDGSVMGMMARSARYWVRQETPRCWVKGCTCARSETEPEEDHPSRSQLSPRDLDEDDSLTSVARGEVFSRDEDNDDSVADAGTASSWAGDRSDDYEDEEARRFAEEYALVPLSRRKQYSAQTFHEAVERFLRGF